MPIYPAGTLPSNYIGRDGHPSYLNPSYAAHLSTLNRSPGGFTHAGSATLSTAFHDSGRGAAPGYDPYFHLDTYGGGYLRGTADLTASLGNFTLSAQRARLVQEQANQSQIDTRRRVWEEAQWERANTLFTEDYRESLIRTELKRARLEPPLDEIWSGRALNVLLRAAAAQEAKDVRGPNVPIPEDVLQHINLTTGAANAGNIGLLKTEALQWPAPLQGAPFGDVVKSLNQQVAEAREQARAGSVVAPGLLKDIQNGLERLQKMLQDNVGEMPPTDYLRAKRYVNLLGEAVKALKGPNIANYLNNSYLKKVKSVADLVDSLTRVQGLEFAAATPGDEAAYRALYQLFADYDAGTNQLNTSAPESGSRSVGN
jgi:hypothetical protein